MAQSKQDLMNQVLGIAEQLGKVIPYVGVAVESAKLIGGIVSRLQEDGRDTTTAEEDAQLAQVEARRTSAEAEFQNLLQG